MTMRIHGSNHSLWTYDTKEVFVMTEKEKKDIVALFISEYQKGKEEKNERED